MMDCDNRMDMIGHHDKRYNIYIRKAFRHVQPFLFNKQTQRRKMNCPFTNRAKNTFLLIGANRNKVLITLNIVVVRES